MALHLKSLEDQVLVLTGASSGIGLVTARMAAQRGARLVLAARSEDALRELAEEINAAGGEAIAVVTDVSNADDVSRLRDAAVERFGRIDSWINDAGVGLYGKLLDVPVEDIKKMFETNVFGVIHGSQAAGRYFRDRGADERGRAGAIINVGSVLSYQAIPLQGAYVASKHAVKGFTDSLRQEFQADDVAASVTLIMPNAIDTPYAKHAPNHMGVEATVPPPAYAPETVARAILHACQTPTRDLTVGGAFKPMTALNNVLPGVVDWFMSNLMIDPQQKDESIAGREPRALATASGQTPQGALEERSGEGRFAMPISGYTQARMHPVASAALLAGAGLVLAGLANRLRDDA
jgi:short-subunit dehydrogenase